MGYTYSHWDGSQVPQSLDADEVMEALADDVITGTTIQQSLLQVASDGISRCNGARMIGLDEMLNQIRTHRENLVHRERPESDLSDHEDWLARSSENPPVDSAPNHQSAEAEAAVSALHDRETLEADASSRFQALMESMRRRGLERNMAAFPRTTIERTSAVARAQRELVRESSAPETIVVAKSPQVSGLYSSGSGLAADQADQTLEGAATLKAALHDLDQLDRDLNRARETGDLASLDAQLTKRVLGAEAANAIRQFQQLSELLESAGFIHHVGQQQELTANGVRKLGEMALRDIFRHLDRDSFGDHLLHGTDPPGGIAESSRKHQFGDPFQLDLGRTVMNAVCRGVADLPVRLRPEDFEVIVAERRTQAATVLMVDASRSMPRRGCFLAAKRVALALNALILTRFPRDTLYVLAVSDIAREIRLDCLHQANWDECAHGTNMQHGFLLARRLLGRHREANHQIILITDGEPTAYSQNGRVHFEYPTSPRTLSETLREVQRCTREKIVINTFMLDRSPYLMEFVSMMTRINRGRALFSTPDRLGEYILVDYASRNGRTLRAQTG